MKRAAELFVIDEWNSDSGFVEKAWTSHSESEPAFISIAVSRTARLTEGSLGCPSFAGTAGSRDQARR